MAFKKHLSRYFQTESRCFRRSRARLRCAVAAVAANGGGGGGLAVAAADGAIGGEIGCSASLRATCTTAERAIVSVSPPRARRGGSVGRSVGRLVASRRVKSHRITSRRVA